MLKAQRTSDIQEITINFNYVKWDTRWCEPFFICHLFHLIRNLWYLSVSRVEIEFTVNDKGCKKNYREREQWENMCRYLLSKYMIASLGLTTKTLYYTDLQCSERKFLG